MPTEQEIVYVQQPMQEKVANGDWDLLKNLSGNKAAMWGIGGAVLGAGAIAFANMLRGKGGGLNDIASAVGQLAGTGLLGPTVASIAQNMAPMGHGGQSGINMHLVQENTLLKSEKYTDMAFAAVNNRICGLETREAVNANDDAWFRRCADREFVHQPHVRLGGGHIPYHQDECCCPTGSATPPVT